MKILTDNWKGNKNTTDTIEVFDFNIVLELFEKLNQKERTQLILETDDSYLLVGGGLDLYILSIVVGEDEEFYDLINAKESDNEDEVSIVTGGQLGSFPKKMIQNKKNVIEALKYYFEKQKPNPELSWDN